MEQISRVPYLLGGILNNAAEHEILELERRIIILTDEQAETLSGALEIENVHHHYDIYQTLKGLHNYKLYPGIQNTEQLGKLLIKTGAIKLNIAESDLKYVNFDAITKDAASEHPGVFTESGYVLKEGAPPGEANMCIVEVEFSSTRLKPYGAVYTLRLPTDDYELDDAMAVMGVDSFEECDVVGVQTAYNCIYSVGIGNGDIEPLNDLSHEMVKTVSEDSQFQTFSAAVEFESPKNIRQVLYIMEHLDNYTLLPRDCTTAADYGEYVLYDTTEFDDLSHFKEEVRDFIDFYEYGQYRMEEDEVRQTSFGMLIAEEKITGEQSTWMSLQ